MSSEMLRQLFRDLDAELGRVETVSPGPDLETNPVTAEGTAADERLRVTITNGQVVEEGEPAAAVVRLGTRVEPSPEGCE